LAAFVRQHRARPFDWGGADCCLSTADGVAAFTGQDFAAPLRGYCSRFGAMRALLRRGHRSVVDYLDATLPRATRARAGDVVALPDPPLDALMIADGRGCAWGQDAHGLVRVAIPATALVWSV
jgi:hypothetical protein